MIGLSLAIGAGLASAPACAADLALKEPGPPASTNDDWSGAYLGGHLGYSWGHSVWTASSGAMGSLGFAQPIDVFAEGGSFFAGVQAGHDIMLANRWVVGAVADISFPSWPNLQGVSIGGNAHLPGPDTYGETVLASGTFRGRFGYAPGSWLFYTTGGLAWSYDRFSLASANETPIALRTGWAAGVGAEALIGNGWSITTEYLHTDFGHTSVGFPSAGQTFTSNLDVDEVRAGLNYHFGQGSPAPISASLIPADSVSFHGQGTLVWQGYPSIRSPYSGTNSLSQAASAKETTDLTLFAGARLWQGAELWFNPEIDQGFGLANTHGVAGFPSGESYKLGQAYPYARIQRAFVRQTVNLGGEAEKVDEDINQFAGTRSTNRLVVTVGRFGVNDIFDTNKYANNPKGDFLNWSLINTATFDYAGDAWGFTYGAAAEWYTGLWTVRAGIFDLSATPAGGNSPLAYGLDTTFSQVQMVGEIERRYQLMGQPGAIKITGFLSRGNAGQFADAVALAQLSGQPADITAVRRYTSRPGISMNLQQQVSENVGLFMRAGWSDGNVEPWDFTDANRTLAIGTAISGRLWGRPDDTVGVAGVLNGISNAYTAYLNAGGMGILVGDGQLPNPGMEHIFEAYYSYALNASVRLSLDYQFINNPAYNTDRGPVNVFAGRIHTQF